MDSPDYWTEVSTVGDLLIRGAIQHPDRNIVVFPERQCSYGSLLRGARKISAGLTALGVRPGQHVGIFTTNSVEFLEGFFGITLLGCVVVPLNARHKAKELNFIIDNADLVALLTTSDGTEYVDFAEVIQKALPSLSKASNPMNLALEEAKKLRHCILLRGNEAPGFLGREDFDRIAATADMDWVKSAHHRVCVRDTALIMYTSGTTANPKGCMLCHEAVTRGPSERARRRLPSDGPPVHWGGGPLFHIGSLAPFIGVLGAGGTYLTDSFFEPGRALDLMARERVTTAWPWFSAIVQALIDHPTFDQKQLDSLRSLFLIAPKPLVERVQGLFPKAEIIQACGMTETAGVFALSDPDETNEQRATFQGKASPGVDIRILDIETGTDATPGQVGEILVRGYCVMDGYYNDPEKTASSLDKEGWLHTGDLYARSADGSLLFNGRLKDMLKVGGENVAAIEVEAFLCEHPAVKLAEVVGRPDPRLDEVPVAFVELRPGKKVTEDELISFCNGRIAKYKIPRAIFFMSSNEWPMSATKVNKRALRAKLAGLTLA